MKEEPLHLFDPESALNPGDPDLKNSQLSVSLVLAGEVP